MRLLKFIPWSELENWSANYYFQKARSGGVYSFEYLGNILKEESNKIKPFENPNNEFGILGVNNKIGIFDNEILLGKQIKQPYKIVENGFLAYNPYRVNVGSIGLKTKEQKFNLISSAYVVFSCDESKILPEFMFLIFKTETFNEMIRSNTKGSVRQTLSYNILASLQIPLPSLDIQEKIVAEYKEKVAQIDKLNLEISNLKDESKDYFLSALGLEKREQFEEKTSKTLLNLKWWSEIENWSAIDESNEKYSAKYPFVKLGDICETNIGLTYSPNDVSYDEEAIPVLRSNNIKENKISYEDLVKVSIKPRKSQMASSGDLLICVRNGSKNLVGKVALIEKDRMSFGAFMAIIRSEYNKFLYYFLMSDYFRNNASFAKSTGINQISQNDLKNFQIPLPPIETQKEICSRLDEAQNQIELRKAQIATLMAAAKEDFEKAIFQI